LGQHAVRTVNARSAPTRRRAGDAGLGQDVTAIASYPLVDPRACAIVAVLGFLGALLHPLFSYGILVCCSLAAAYSVANGDRRRWRDLPERSEAWGLLRLGVAAFLAGCWPLIVLTLSLPREADGQRATAGASRDGLMGVVHAQAPEGQGWEFGDFGGNGAPLAPPPKTGHEAELEAEEYADFEDRYRREEQLYVDHEEETGNDEPTETPATAAGPGEGTFVEWSPPSPSAAPATDSGRPKPSGATGWGRPPKPTDAEPAAPAAASAVPRSLGLLVGFAVIWQVFYTPLALMVALTTRSVAHTFNPGDGLHVVRRMGPAFGGAFAVYGVLLAVRWVLGAIVPPATPAGSLAGAIADAYVCLAVGCALGRAAWKKPPELELARSRAR